MKINALQINIMTDKGILGTKMFFENKLNILWGDNSTGKSTCIEAIIYALGLEELLGGKKAYTLKPALREKLEFKNRFYKVLESYVYLEIENKKNEIVTIKRSIKSENRNNKLVTVIQGSKLTKGENSYKIQDMYLHDPGAATHLLGFHSFLEEFLGWSLPYIPSYKKREIKLYLQTIFSACIIEQVKGWSDFLSTVPTYYGIKHVSKRVIEYILGLDVINNEKRREKVKNDKNSISLKWSNIIESMNVLTEEVQGEIRGLPKKPVIFDADSSDISIVINDNQSNFLLEEKKVDFMKEFMTLDLTRLSLVKDKVEKKEKEIDEKTDKLDELEFDYKNIYTDYKIESRNLKGLNQQLKSIEEDLIKNKDIKKLNKLGSDLEINLAKNNCPTCHQTIKNSLLPQDIQQVPMNIDENIKFLKEQKRIIEFHIKVTKLELEKKDKEIKNLRIKIKKLRKDIRDLKQELTEDERIPSVSEIKKKVDLKNKIEKYERVEEQFDSYIRKLQDLSDEWQKILKEESELPKEHYSKLDYKKKYDLQKYFRENVTKFGYKSKSPDEIEISDDKYFPTVNGFDMKFDSSASDHIRAIWAYTCALYQTSNKYDSHHPHFMIFDEPGQHQMSSDHIKNFFIKLSEFSNSCQSIVTTSLEEPNFELAVEDLNYNLIKIKEWSLFPLDKE